MLRTGRVCKRVISAATERPAPCVIVTHAQPRRNGFVIQFRRPSHELLSWSQQMTVRLEAPFDQLRGVGRLPAVRATSSVQGGARRDPGQIEVQLRIVLGVLEVTHILRHLPHVMTGITVELVLLSVSHCTHSYLQSIPKLSTRRLDRFGLGIRRLRPTRSKKVSPSHLQGYRDVATPPSESFPRALGSVLSLARVVRRGLGWGRCLFRYAVSLSNAPARSRPLRSDPANDPSERLTVGPTMRQVSRLRPLVANSSRGLRPRPGMRK